MALEGPVNHGRRMTTSDTSYQEHDMPLQEQTHILDTYSLTTTYSQKILHIIVLSHTYFQLSVQESVVMDSDVQNSLVLSCTRSSRSAGITAEGLVTAPAEKPATGCCLH